MKDHEKEVVAETLTDCTPLDKYATLDSWWTDFKKKYSMRKKIMMNKLNEKEKEDTARLKEISDLENEIAGKE